MTEIQRIDDQLKRAYRGEAWHGPSVMEVLAGVTAAQAAARPATRAHTIWEIVNHISAWTSVVRRRILGESAAQPIEGDFPEAADASEAAWKDALAEVERNYESLRAELAVLEESRLDQSCSHGQGTCYIHLHGTVQHYLYHAGQIAILKKMI